MLNIIRRILQEESEMKEMGMKLNKLQQLQPSNYLLQSLKQKQSRSYRTTSERAKSDAQQLNSLVPELYQSLKDLDWTEIGMNKNPNEHYYLELPKHIMDLFKLVSKLYIRIPAIYNRLIDNVDKVQRLHEDYQRYIKNEDINMYLEQNRNRTHFPDGLPQSLLGYKLGYKMYRKLIDDLWFIQSQDNASKEVQDIYRQLLQQTDLNCVVTKTSILIMRRDLTKQDKLKVLSEFILQKYEYSDSTKLKIQRDIILDGPLLRELGGERRLQQLMDKIGEYSQNSRRLSYKNGDPLEYEYNYDYTQEEEEVVSQNDDGEDEEEETRQCEYCNGDGETECPECSGEGDIDGEECEYCGGSGFIDCGDCGGSGRI